MKRKHSVALFAILLASMLFAGSAVAQSTLVEIRNSSGEKRKICMYKDTDKLAKIPYKCFELIAKEKVVWNRAGDTANFKAKVFRPAAVLDKLLHYARVPGLTTQIVLGVGSRFAHSAAPVQAAVTKYRLKVCNKRFNEKIYFAISFETNDQYLTEGWWSVTKGQCVDLEVSDRLKQKIKLDYGNLPRLYFYAETWRAKPMYWTGGTSGLMLCVNDKKAFELKVARGRGVSPMARPCGLSQKQVSLRRIEAPKTNQVYFYLRF
jgi:uncharacterized membrane protein